MLVSHDDTLVQLLEELAGIATTPPLALERQAALFDRLAATLHGPTFTVTLIGDYGSGKSSLLDTLLEIKRPHLPVTQILRAGETETVTLCLDGTARMPLPPHQLEQIAGQDAAVPGSVVEWTFANSWIGPDVRIVDLAEVDGILPADGAEYLADTNAFVLVVHAARVFSQKEKALLAALLGERDPRQALIVVNNIDTVEADDLGEVRDWVRTTLQSYFIGSDGAFDEPAFERHVFYVNQKEAASVAALGERLRNLIEDRGERAAAARAMAIQMALAPAASLQQYLVKAGIELDRPQQELDALRLTIKREQAERESALLDLQHDAADIGDQIARKVYASLLHLLDTINARWETDAPHLVQWDELGVQPLFNALISLEHRRVLRRALTRKIEEYLREQITAWSDALPQLIAPEIARLAALFQPGVDVRLETLGHTLASTHYLSLDDERLRAMLNAMMRQLLLGGSAIEQILQRTLVRGLVAGFLIFAGPMLLKMSGIVALIAAEATNSSRQLAAQRHEMLVQMRDRLIAGLREELALPGFGDASFIRLDTFMQLVGSGDTPLLAHLRAALPDAVRASLARPAHSSAEQVAFIQHLNAALGHGTHLPAHLMPNLELSAELRYLQEHDVDQSQTNRLLLAEAFPEHVRPKVRDLLDASVGYQVGRIAQQAAYMLQQHDQSAQSDARLVAAQAAATAATKRQEELAAISQRVRELLAAAGLAVYGRDFSDAELRLIAERKQAVLMPEPSKSMV
jgi:hypothetical protein